MADINQIKKLREETGISIGECKKALEEAKGDEKLAKDKLREWGAKIADKRASREALEGIVVSYIHPNNKVGVLLDMRCESDFVAKSDDFKDLSHEICLQIAAMDPSYIKEEDVPKEEIEKKREIFLKQLEEDKKPKEIKEKIVEGKIKKDLQESVLLYQPWVKEEKKTIEKLLEEYTAKIGEKIKIERFTRYQI